MPIRRRPWQPRPEPAARAVHLPASVLSLSRRACVAALVLGIATAGSLTGIITSNHRHGIVSADAATSDPSTTGALTSGSATTPPADGSRSGRSAAPGSLTSAAALPVVAATTPDSQGHAGVIPVPLAPKAVAGPIPTLAWQAYHQAAAGSGCHLPWYLLAGIGKIESNHGRYGGARFDIAGTVHPAIYGPPTAYGRAMGPMQFIPPTWTSYAADGNGDGVSDPQNVFDATKAAAHYLCRAGGPDLSGLAAQRRAVFAYNHLASYVADVLAFATAYSHGASERTVPIVPITYPKAAPTTSRPSSRGTHSSATTTSGSTAPVSTTSPPTTSSPTTSVSTTSASTTSAPSSTSSSRGSSSPTGSSPSPTCATTSVAPTSTPNVSTPSASETSARPSSGGRRAGRSERGSGFVTPSSAAPTAPSTTPTASAAASGSCAPCPAPTTTASPAATGSTAPACPPAMSSSTAKVIATLTTRIVPGSPSRTKS